MILDLSFHKSFRDLNSDYFIRDNFYSRRFLPATETSASYANFRGKKKEIVTMGDEI